MFIPQSRHVYCKLMNLKTRIPEEYQQKLIDNQHKIDEYEKLAKKAYAENQRLLDELLILNGIEKKDGENNEPRKAQGHINNAS